MLLDEALRLAFPGCSSKSESIYLTNAQMEAVARLAGGPFNSALIVRNHPDCPKPNSGVVPERVAYTDTHRVRTKPETLMLIVTDGAIERIDVLSFDEPPSYQPKALWYAKFSGSRLDDDLAVAKKIPAISGASLSAKSTVDAARRILAIDKVLRENRK